MDQDNKTFAYRLANDQITTIQKEYEQPGWTVWALLIALANVIWILINEIEINKAIFAFHESVILTICMFLLFSGSNILIKVISSGKSDISQDRFTYPKILLKSTRFNSLFELSVLFGLLLLIKTITLDNNHVLVLLRSYLIGMIVLQVLGIIVTMIPFPTKKNHDVNSFVKILILIFFSALPLFLFVHFITGLDISSISFLTSLKFSLLIFLTYFLLSKLTNYASKNPILRELEKIKHDLAFNLIPPSDALERIEIVVDGLKLQHLFREDITSILNQIHQLAQISDDAGKNFALIRNRISEIKKENKNQEIESDPIIKGLNHNIDLALERAKIIATTIQSLRKKIDRKMAMLYYITKNNPEINDIKINIHAILKKGSDSISDLQNELDKTRKEY